MRQYRPSILLFLLIMIFFAASCQKSEQTSQQPQDGTDKKEGVLLNEEIPESEYIQSYTGGLISRDQIIEIHTNQEINLKASSGDQVPTNILKFSPDIKGYLVLENSHTLLFHPSEKMDEGQEYKATLDISALFDEVNENNSSFEFSFTTKKQDYEVSFEPVRVGDETVDVTLVGSIVTADDADNNKVEQILELPRLNGDAVVEWEHDGRIHIVTIKRIKQKTDTYELEFKWDGKVIGVNRKGSEKLIIPGEQSFTLSDYIVDSKENSNYLTLYFSNPVDPGQDLTGLIELNNSDQLRTSVSGNTIKVYPKTKVIGEISLTIHSSLKSEMGKTLGETLEFPVVFYAAKPEVKMIKESGIYTSSSSMVIPFEAITLQAVDIQIIRVFESNMLRFFQFNSTMKSSNRLELVGRPVFQGSVELDPEDAMDLYTWNRFSVDLSSYIEEEPGAIYRVYINFRRSQSLYPGAIKEGEDRDYMDVPNNGNWNGPGAERSNWDYYSGGYSWRDRDDPTTDSYYWGTRKRVSQSLLCSDIGMIAKGESDNRIHVVLSSLKDTKPIKGADIFAYNYQLQEIGRGESDNQGMATINCEGVPFLVTAKNEKQSNYLRIDSASALSLSSFDVEGTNVARGIKGYLYGERGVWRPGDPVHLTFILEDKENRLPENLPVVMELINPSGQTTERQVNKDNFLGIYRFILSTDIQAPTGTWTARARLGDYIFEKDLPIETVKPNRLKVKFTPDVEKLTASNSDANGDYSAKIFAQWLHGAPAQSLKASVELSLSPSVTRFEGYSDYSFDDVTLSFSEPKRSIFEGNLDSEGNAEVKFSLKTTSVTPGTLRANFSTKVFEEGGNFSINNIAYPYCPYDNYVGLRTPPGDRSRGMLLTDEDHVVDIVTLDSLGKPVSRNNIKVSLYKIRWRWWWDKSPENMKDFMNLEGVTAISRGNVNTENGKGEWTLRIDYPKWGRYLLIAEDPQSGHRSSKIIYMDWPGWAGSPQQGGESANILSIFTDKKDYTTGEEVELSIPSSAGGRALVSIERGATVVDSWWVETEDKMTVHRFPVSREMGPTAYIHVSLLQPVVNRNNDSPIRMFGITPIQVKDPDTILIPKIAMDQELRPEKSFSISVSEQRGRQMAYTIAVVDEGLLDLTNFKTPNPWNHFYGKEALSVRTWDLYGEVIGMMNGNFGSILAAGGGDFLIDSSSQEQNRFKPVVLYEGPFQLDAGESKTHVLMMPHYVGSVRTMIIASNGRGAYGWADDTTPVKQDLMVQGSLPRLVGPEETFDFPVTLFSSNKEGEKVMVTLETSTGIDVIGSSYKEVTIGTDGEMTTRFSLKTDPGAKTVHVNVIAQSNSGQSSWGTDLEVREPNRPRTQVEYSIIDPKKELIINVGYFGNPGSNSAILEVSSLPPIDLERRSRWLIRYPHGCIEQTTSSVFPQLYLDDLKALTAEEKQKIQQNINAGIERLGSFQLPSGGLSYWPGGHKESDWGTTYAGHFLLEAKQKGYHVPEEMLNKWINWQKEQANSWRESDYLNQAYRLYSLVLSGESQRGAMNRLREQNDVPQRALWRLAAAYAMDGKKQIALDLTKNLDWDFNAYRSSSASYGSALRDKAMVLETLALIDEEEKAYPLLESISEKLSSNTSLSTQTLSYCLIAIGQYAGHNTSENKIDMEYTIDGGSKQSIQSDRYSITMDLKEENRNIKIKNLSSGKLFLSLAVSGTPAAGNEEELSRNMSVSVEYKTSDGRVVNPRDLTAGTDFMAIVSVNNPKDYDIEEIALSTVFPSGWEILNTRLNQTGEDSNFDQPEYQDYRDDRVYSYFDLKKKEGKSFVFYITAAYPGEYYFPGIISESMYNLDTFSHLKGFPVRVTGN
ncbi:MAG: hypothetical protein JEY91_01655 [Spirochaetaceae bacterium]|nr:hypothetical protein [Spirochaetaceae bacterium]